MNYFFTSESVTPWHPDKICDRISDAVLDACLEQDPYARVACECFITTWQLIIWWEITTTAKIDVDAIARRELLYIWYDSPQACFDGQSCGIINLIHQQSVDIAKGVDIGWAGDQGIMFWYATDETNSYMPLSIDLAHKLAHKLFFVRKEWIIDYLLPDGKTQVTLCYDENNNPKIDTIVVSAQHKAGINIDTIKEDILEKIIKPTLWPLYSPDIILYINPTGIFTIGWPHGDTGLTGRKIIVDTYGGWARHGGWAFSGKDPTKVDRSGAYMARYLAKHIVATWLATRCELQISYAIGIDQPLSIFIETWWTERVEKEKIIQLINNNFDLSPEGIISLLSLRNQRYIDATSFGHFGREQFSWEKLDKVDLFRSIL